MKFKIKEVILVLLIAFFFIACEKQDKVKVTEQVTTQSDLEIKKQNKEDFVNKAVALIQQEGITAFDDFETKYSEFYSGDNYIFVIDNTGILLVDPPSPSLENTNVYNYQDPNGKYLFQEFINVGKNQGSGWVDYLWPHPETQKPVRKTSFVKQIQIDDTILIVGSGLYLE